MVSYATVVGASLTENRPPPSASRRGSSCSRRPALRQFDAGQADVIQKGEAFVLQVLLRHRGVVGSKLLHVLSDLFHRRGHTALFRHGQDPQPSPHFSRNKI